MTPMTKADPRAASWAINDPVTRLRLAGSERVYDLAGADRWVLGALPECSLRLDDPTGRVSRLHAALVRDGEIWTMHDLGSTNGLRLNGEERRSFQLAPGDEIELGGLMLIVESGRLMELHELLRRWLGGATARLREVDRALREIRETAHLRAALILRGAGSLTGVARRLHRVTLGDRPFVAIGPKERGLEGLDRATNGTLYIDASKLPRDLPRVIASLHAPDTYVRLVVYADSSRSVVELAAMISRIATLWIPPIDTGGAELDRLLEAYGFDAVDELGASHLGFGPRDVEWIRASGISTLEKIEETARRLVALRNWGVSGGAKRLKLNHGALSRWARKLHLPT
jgi:Inner membrane component of T3SS, cytoplasmic domain